MTEQAEDTVDARTEEARRLAAEGWHPHPTRNAYTRGPVFLGERPPPAAAPAEPETSSPSGPGGLGDGVADAEATWPPLAPVRQEAGTGTVAPGYRPVHRPRSRRAPWLITAAAVVIAFLVAWLVWPVGPGPQWPASVTVMRAESARACSNPDVASQPGKVNFACAKSTRQILWVFALLTSGGSPRFAGGGREGLEPITPAQGNQLAIALNLGHPYDPMNPVDSLAVAARAINSIIGGAVVVTTAGTSVIQPGLEASPAGCSRYTGSAAVSSRAGYPPLCVKPLTATGRAVLAADAFTKWMPTAGAATAGEAAVLFAHAGDPGSPQVRAILRHLPGGAR